MAESPVGPGGPSVTGGCVGVSEYQDLLAEGDSTRSTLGIPLLQFPDVQFGD